MVIKTIQQQAQSLVNLHNKMHEQSADPNKDQVFGKVRELMLNNMEEHGATYITDTYNRVKLGFQNSICPIDIDTL
jgi:hypothetical protein